MRGTYADFLLRLGMDLICTLVLIRLIYYRIHRRADLFLTFFSFNLIIFLIAFLLNRVEISLGAAFGLFAVFGMLRYRTEGISTPDMTYLFMVIALGLIMAVSRDGWLHLLLIGATVLGMTQILEGGVLAPRESRIQMMYDSARKVHADHRAGLIRELRERTGLQIHRVDVREIDFRRDTARLTLYFSTHDERNGFLPGSPPDSPASSPGSEVRFDGGAGPDDTL